MPDAENGAVTHHAGCESTGTVCPACGCCAHCDERKCDCTGSNRCYAYACGCEYL